MAEKIYVLQRLRRATEARWQLSDEDYESLIEKVYGALNEAGGEMLVRFQTVSSEYRAVWVCLFRDMESWCNFHTAVYLRQGLNLQRYFDNEFTLGYAPPDSALHMMAQGRAEPRERT